MVTVKTMDQYRKLQAQRAKKLRTYQRRGPITTAKYMAVQLRMMSPVSSGRMLGSIKREGSLVRMGGSNPLNGFPYIHWVNATPGTGLERIAYLKKWHGDMKKYSYAEVPNRTGEPGFYWIAQTRARRFGVKAALQANRAVLRAQF